MSATVHIEDSTWSVRVMTDADKERLISALSVVPTTREAAIAALVETDVARWGEAEREPSRRSHASRTLGLALNELANRALMWTSLDSAALRAAAKKSITSADRSYLRKGG